MFILEIWAVLRDKAPFISEVFIWVIVRIIVVIKFHLKLIISGPYFWLQWSLKCLVHWAHFLSLCSIHVKVLGIYLTEGLNDRNWNDRSITFISQFIPGVLYYMLWKLCKWHSQEARIIISVIYEETEAGGKICPSHTVRCSAGKQTQVYLVANAWGLCAVPPVPKKGRLAFLNAECCEK